MEYAAAVEGMPQVLLGTGKLRELPPVIEGPPNVPVGFRVSAMRHGATGTNCKATGGGALGRKL
jgi:hypothetical protein